MNTNISPNKEAAFFPYKSSKSPFKKFPSRLPKQQQHYNYCSPFKYINTDANPEMGKHMAQSAHHLGSHNPKNELLALPIIRKVEQTSIIKNIKSHQPNKSQLFYELNDKSHNHLAIQTNMLTNRSRKLSYNQLSISPYSPKINYRKSELRPNTQTENQQVPQTRDRKLSYQVSSQTIPTQTSFSRKQNNQTHFWLNSYDQTNRRQSDLLSGMGAAKQTIFQENYLDSKIGKKHYQSHKSIPDEPKSMFPSFKNSKFRKNSDHQQNQHNLQKDIKTQVPSFLLKKMHKQNQNTKNQQSTSLCKDQKQKPLTLSPQNSMKQKKLSLKDFILIKELGQGKFGKVLLVKQKMSGFVCAMKVFKKSQIQSDNFIEQFIRQMKIQMFLNNPNIIKMYGYFDDLSFIYILLQVALEGTLYKFLQTLHHEQRLKRSAMTMIQGEELQQGLTGLTLKQTAFIMYQICSGVNYLHSNNIIHRDLKPQNIVIHQKTIKLCDFGWSVFKGSQMRTTFCGTPLYLCPELITGQEYDQKVDIWAIGIMLYQFLIGPNPFNIKKEDDLTNIIHQSVNLNEKDLTLRNKIDHTVIDLINGCLNKDPIERLDIRQIINHEFFKKYSPQLVQNNSGMLSRNSSNFTMNEMMK